jgi:hypothetical protein
MVRLYDPRVPVATAKQEALPYAVINAESGMFDGGEDLFRAVAARWGFARVGLGFCKLGFRVL